MSLNKSISLLGGSNLKFSSLQKAHESKRSQNSKPKVKQRKPYFVVSNYDALVSRLATQYKTEKMKCGKGIFLRQRNIYRLQGKKKMTPKLSGYPSIK